MTTSASAVLDIVRSEGLACGDLVAFRSANNTVFLLEQLAVVAKVHDSETAAARELRAGHALATAGAPVVAPAPGIGEQVHESEGVYVTFWNHVAGGTSDDLSSTAVAVALRELHLHLVGLADWVADRTFAEQLVDAMRALQDQAFAPQLGDADRRLLLEALGHARSASEAWSHDVVHGSPHRMNVLDRDGAPVFIDLETIQIGPVEWDLAHLEPEVASAYPADHDADRLQVCRTAVSAATATWCWGGLHRGPDMRTHAEHHLDVVRSAG